MFYSTVRRSKRLANLPSTSSFAQNNERNEAQKRHRESLSQADRLATNRRRVEATFEQQRQLDRIRHLHENMTPQQQEHRARNIIANMTPQQQNEQRIRHQHENMPIEQQEAHRNAQRHRGQHNSARREYVEEDVATYSIGTMDRVCANCQICMLHAHT